MGAGTAKFWNPLFEWLGQKTFFGFGAPLVTAAAAAVVESWNWNWNWTLIWVIGFLDVVLAVILVLDSFFWSL